MRLVVADGSVFKKLLLSIQTCIYSSLSSKLSFIFLSQTFAEAVKHANQISNHHAMHIILHDPGPYKGLV